jgi:hypothetical protein
MGEKAKIGHGFPDGGLKPGQTDQLTVGRKVTLTLTLIYK